MMGDDGDGTGGAGGKRKVTFVALEFLGVRSN